MNDSCSERKLEPGLAAMYSKPSDLTTSTMKSDPGFSTVRTSTSWDSGSVSAANCLAEGDAAVPRGGVAGTCCAATTGPTSAAAPAAAPTAAPFRKPPRSKAPLDFGIEPSPANRSSNVIRHDRAEHFCSQNKTNLLPCRPPTTAKHVTSPGP